MKRVLDDYQLIERSIIKKYRKEIWSKFMKAVKDYQLIEDNDKIMVCISGGKDSFLLAKCMQELHKHTETPFEVTYVCMDPGYSQKHKDMIISMADRLHIPLSFFETDIFQIAETLNNEKPCYMCARMRRGYLYDKARMEGCNKIALGHHFDDVIETGLLSMFYGSEVKTMLPKLKSDNFEGMELIRPLYLIHESDILAWRDHNKLEFINCACKFTERNANDDLESLSKRKEIKELITNLRKVDKNIDMNIFKSLANINLDAVLGYRKDGIYHNYLDDYNKK